MVRKLSAYESGIAERTHLRHKIALVAVVILLAATVDLGARDGTKDWVVLENCRLIMNPANDGDSFHASVGEKEYLFRLYLVDAPETDALTPGRLVEQSKYFEITVPQAIEVGEAAKAFTRQKLSQPFTVFTRMTDAMGRSKIERFYAFVQTREGDLGEQLVRNGLARNYGFRAVPPGLRNSRLEVEKLQQLEDEAKQEKIGGWGISLGRLNERLEKPDTFSFFTAGGKDISGRKRARVVGEGLPVGKIDINTATEEELKSIPGIGPVMASRIIAARPFQSADDLKKVNGIGDKKY